MSKTLRTFLALGLLAALATGGGIFLNQFLKEPGVENLPVSEMSPSVRKVVDQVNSEFRSHWESEGVSPAPAATRATLARRLSLALTGAIPSYEELQCLEMLDSEASMVDTWLDHLFSDQRYANYIAERLTRVYVGVEPGPFLVYRRRRMVNWLSEQLAANRSYDAVVRDMISAQGLWTSKPEANFITVSVMDNAKKKGPDEVKLAARTSRAFLGISLDCMQCHDDKFGDYWMQEDFHQLAAFYSQSEVAITGVRENRKIEYETKLRGSSEDSKIGAEVPFDPDLLPQDGNLRRRLAVWITHPQNDAFSRAAVNRAWALLFGRPLIEPVDDIPLEGPYPPGMETLANDFAGNGFDLQRLIRTIANSEAFLRSGTTGDSEHPATVEMERAWAAFPLTPLRPEQVAGSVIQASSLKTVDAETHIIARIRRFGDTSQFVKRFGDKGEDELMEESATIPQLLLLMNGKLVKERSKSDDINNGSNRITNFSGSNSAAVDNAFLTVLTREPTETERAHFETQMDESPKKQRAKVMEDLYWALINSTEFSWNR